VCVAGMRPSIVKVCKVAEKTRPRGRHTPKLVPEVFHFDRQLALIIMRCVMMCCADVHRPLSLHILTVSRVTQVH
jgi:hypothetical protein